MDRQEGNPSYLSQSPYPAKGTTVGGRTDDPTATRAARPAAAARLVHRAFDPGRGAGVVDVGLWPRGGASRARAQAPCGAEFYPSMLRRTGLLRRRERLALLEDHSAGTCGLLTERTRRRLAAARSARPRHIAATHLGDLVCVDTFLHRQAQGRRQGVADHRLQCRLLVTEWPACCRSSPPRPRRASSARSSCRSTG
jgi:hypothetical protein